MTAVDRRRGTPRMSAALRLDRSQPTQSCRRHFSGRATGALSKRSFADHVESSAPCDSGHSRVATADRIAIAAERLQPKGANWRCRPIAAGCGFRSERPVYLGTFLSIRRRESHRRGQQSLVGGRRFTRTRSRLNGHIRRFRTYDARPHSPVLPWATDRSYQTCVVGFAMSVHRARPSIDSHGHGWPSSRTALPESGRAMQ